MSDEKYTVAAIARITGYNRSTVTRWIDKQKIKSAQMQGNAPLYSAQVLADFKKSHSTKDKGVSKGDALLREKDARISALEDEIKLLKKQLDIKDRQIEVATQLADQAQKLNLADKPQLTHADRSDERTSLSAKVDNQSKKTVESPHESWLGRIFGKK